VRGIVEFQLGGDLSHCALRQAVQSNQGRIANQLGNIICDFHLTLL
jgi:hypothetical protein